MLLKFDDWGLLKYLQNWLFTSWNSIDKKGVVRFFQESLTWNKDDTISISLIKGGGIIWLFCQKMETKIYFSCVL